ncbi:hypothetical protein NUACC21_36260 [Scytonema sp. NUACC21]
MTNAQPPEDVSTRLKDIDDRLEVLEDEFDLLRTVQNANRRELRGNSQSIARLERTVLELGNIARLHQQALRQSQQNIDRIWRYLESQISSNGNGREGDD